MLRTSSIKPSVSPSSVVITVSFADEHFVDLLARAVKLPRPVDRCRRLTAVHNLQADDSHNFITTVGCTRDLDAAGGQRQSVVVGEAIRVFSND